jgi:hypothetical protein
MNKEGYAIYRNDKNEIVEEKAQFELVNEGSKVRGPNPNTIALNIYNLDDTMVEKYLDYIITKNDLILGAAWSQGLCRIRPTGGDEAMFHLINTADPMVISHVNNHNTDGPIFESTFQGRRGNRSQKVWVELAKSPAPLATYVPKLESPRYQPHGLSLNIELRDRTSVEVIWDLYNENPESKVGLFNFANFYNPGGGFLNDSEAQEEDICRKTNLYMSLFSIATKNGYKGRNKQKYAYWGQENAENSWDLASVWVTPRVRILKANHVVFDVYSAAAIQFVERPGGLTMHFRNKETSNRDINKRMYGFSGNGDEGPNSNPVREVHKTIIYNIISTMADGGVDIPVLGAFGSGAFMNSPEKMAALFREVIDNHPAASSFKKIVFAIPSVIETSRTGQRLDDLMEGLQRNMKAYHGAFDGMLPFLGPPENVNPHEYPGYKRIPLLRYSPPMEYIVHQIGAIFNKTPVSVRYRDSNAMPARLNNNFVIMVQDMMKDDEFASMIRGYLNQQSPSRMIFAARCSEDALKEFKTKYPVFHFPEVVYYVNN